MEKSTLQTRLIQLCPFTAEDIKSLYEINLSTALGASSTLEETEENFTSGIDGNHQIRLSIKLRTTGETIGFANYETVTIGLRKGPENADRISIGIMIDPDKSPPGAGGEATEILLGQMFEHLPKARIAYCITSGPSLSKLGGLLTYLPVDMVQRDEVYFRGTYWDRYWYAVQRSWWLRHKASATRDSTRRIGKGRWSRRPVRSTP